MTLQGGVSTMKARTLIGLAGVAVILAVSAITTGSARADVAIESFSVDVSTSQAGGHPNILIDARFSNRMFENQEQKQDVEDPGCSCQDVRDILVHMPTGFIGNPHAIPQCTLVEFALNKCSEDTQVGIVFLSLFSSENPEVIKYEEEVGEPLGIVSPIYNLQPHPGKAGAIGSIAPLIELPIETQLSARTGSDYGLDATTLGLFHILAIPRLSLYLWGNPADPEHDKSRFSLPHIGRQNACGGTLNDQMEEPENKKKPFGFGCHGFTPSSAANIPYLQNPTTCAIPLTAGLDLFYYENTFLHADTPWPATTGCDQLKFSPSLTAKPTTTQGDTASGIDMEIKVPQTQSPSVPSPSELREVTLTLPKGFSLAPPGADGKVACTDQQLNFTSEGPADCPEFSKIGTVTLDSSALPDPIPGAIYIGEPLPGQTFRVFLTAEGFATNVKLKGTVHLDPQTGQIVSRFVNLPQAPFQDFDMHFFGSERGIFATPTRCGSYEVEAEFAPWAAALPNQTSIATFEVDSSANGAPCPGLSRPFSPRFQGGTPDNTAGVSSPLTLQLKRNDGDQNLTGLTVQFPPGLIQSIRGITKCPEQALSVLALQSHTGLLEQASPACPSSSQIGTVVAGAGAGTRNLYNRGRVFLAGPYKGAPLSVVAAVSALGGPYDLGNVIVRSAITVDPVSAQVSAVSDPIPLLQEGVPLRVRSLQLEFARPGFNLTPTNCAPKSIDATVYGDEGGAVTPRAFYQVANCANLPFGPKLALRLTGGLGRRGHPAIHALLRTNPGEANNHFISVTLPKGELLDNSHIGAICTRVAFAADTCPPGSKLGQVEVTTPLLDEPLKGGIYLRSSQHDLPDMALDLEGLIDFEAVGRIDSVSGRLRTSFEAIPDVPVSEIKFDLAGGSKGLLVNSESLCGVTKRASVVMTGQNGATSKAKTNLQPICGSKERHKRHGRQGRRGRKAVR
jgi:hypothetical protein